MSRDRSSTIVWGLVLIGVGIVLGLAMWIGWDKLWPVFPLLAGLGFLVGYILSGFKEEGFVFIGTLAALLGLFLFGFTLGLWEWGDMDKLWPVFPLILGVAFFALFLADRKHDAGALAVGCAGVIVGIVALAITYGFVGSEIVKLWPLLIILGGLIGLVGALVRMIRRE
jgi:hypothetical protein